MAYTIRYGPSKPKQNRARFIWTSIFFLLFLLMANLFFSKELFLLREMMFPHTAQTFLQDYFEAVVNDAH